MSFALYLFGFVILIGGVAWGMSTAGVSTTWVLITSVILLGIGVLTAVVNERSKDRPSRSIAGRLSTSGASRSVVARGSRIYGAPARRVTRADGRNSPSPTASPRSVVHGSPRSGRPSS